MQPIISIITTVLNRRQDIERMIDSVILQDELNWELIVVDNGSSDGTYEYVSSLQSKKIKLISCETRGLSFARNQGILSARGAWLVTLDSDNKFYDKQVLGNIRKLTLKFPYINVFMSMNVGFEGASMSHLNGAPTNNPCSLTDYFRTSGEFSAIVKREWALKNLYPEISGAIIEFPSCVYAKAAMEGGLMFVSDVFQFYSTGSANRVCDQALEKQRAWELMKYYELLTTRFSIELFDARLVYYKLSAKYWIYKKACRDRSPGISSLKLLGFILNFMPYWLVNLLIQKYKMSSANK